MLNDCHRRIEHFPHILRIVADGTQPRSLADEATTAVQEALSYFLIGGQRHTADHEASLFPRLLAASGFAKT